MPEQSASRQSHIDEIYSFADFLMVECGDRLPPEVDRRIDRLVASFEEQANASSAQASAAEGYSARFIEHNYVTCQGLLLFTFVTDVAVLADREQIASLQTLVDKLFRALHAKHQVFFPVVHPEDR